MRTLLTRLWGTAPWLTGVGLSMIGLLGATVIALLVDPREIGGAPAWMKPAKFAASIAIYTLTLAWVFTNLPEWPRTRRFVGGITAVTLIIEIVIIDLQAWRGTASHFNAGTTLDGVLFSVMGLAIVVQTCASIAVAVALWRQRFSDSAMGWALRIGMTLTILGAFSGGLMTRPTQAQLEDLKSGRPVPLVGAHTVGAPDGGPGLPGTGWSRDHGDLRVPHFLGLHALQILPLLTIAVARRSTKDEQRRVRLTLGLSTSYGALFALLMWQALRGQSIMRPDAMMLTALAGWSALTVIACWAPVPRAGAARRGAAAY